ncbi:MAG: ABC transporter permease [Gammaproteobacteria bacterium]|nr:ABC transporter permease [Gammaproteobacteria bacterium]
MRGVVVGFICIALLIGIIWAVRHGRRIIRTERTDAVFGNPEKALGGYHWVFMGVASVLLMWLVFSWDAARSFFPTAGNELCQVAKVNTALNPIRAAFPIENRLLRSTSLIERDTRQLNRIIRDLESSGLTESNKSAMLGVANQLQQLLGNLSAGSSLDPKIAARIDDIAQRINAEATNLTIDGYPGEPDAVAVEKASAQPGWGTSNTELPTLPETALGRKFDSVAVALNAVAKDFSQIKNESVDFNSRVENIDAAIKDLKALSDQLDAELVEEHDYHVKQLDRMFKRIDDGAVFPPSALDPIEKAMIEFEQTKRAEQGSLRLIDSLAMPGGTIVAGSTACTEQGSGRWLPKPSDTLRTLVRISDPDVGYKGVPLLWYEMKPLGEMLAFFIPDWVADLVPGEYPRHNEDGTISKNLKTKVLNFATGNYDSLEVPVPMGHIWDSILRVVAGLFLGIILGVPLGLFMGLSRFAKGFFDPLIELYRPVPPLAWAPLILTIFGIQDDGKIFLLFMVAFAIMVISARTGATGTQLSKIHAAHSLGASNRQILREVILPNSLPEILTGIRIAIGVCWGTLVAAEMLAGTTGIGFVENVARKQSDYEIIWTTIIILGLLGLLFDMIMRWVIAKTIPWRGKG